jgi:hypothetical protein
MGNGELFHVAAFVDKRGPIGVNTNKRRSARFRKQYANSGCFHHEVHAEVALVLRLREVPQQISVVRFYKSGEPTMAQPCVHCQNFLRQRGVKRVRYTNWLGAWETMTL